MEEALFCLIEFHILLKFIWKQSYMIFFSQDREAIFFINLNSNFSVMNIKFQSLHKLLIVFFIY